MSREWCDFKTNAIENVKVYINLIKQLEVRDYEVLWNKGEEWSFDEVWGKEIALSTTTHNCNYLQMTVEDFKDLFKFSNKEIHNVLNSEYPFNTFRLSYNESGNFYQREVLWLLKMTEEGKFLGKDLVTKLEGTVNVSHILQSYKERFVLYDEVREAFGNKQSIKIQKKINQKYSNMNLLVKGKELHQDEVDYKKFLIQNTFWNMGIFSEAEVPYWLYYVQLVEKKSKKSFWKIGIENKKCNRWKNTLDYKAKYIWSLKGDAFLVKEMETHIKKKYETGVNKDTPIFKTHSGHTEALGYDFLDISPAIIKKKINYIKEV